MPLSNLNNVHLGTTETTEALDALTQLENALAGININLTSEDRQRYGSVNEQNKLFVNKIYDYHKNQPQLQNAQVDWTEFENDYNSRMLMENLTGRLENLLTRLKNAKTLYDYDNYQEALIDYAYTNYMAGTSTPGYETKQNDLKQFFSRTPKKPSETPTDGSETPRSEP